MASPQTYKRCSRPRGARKTLLAITPMTTTRTIHGPREFTNMTNNCNPRGTGAGSTESFHHKSPRLRATDKIPTGRVDVFTYWPLVSVIQRMIITNNTNQYPIPVNYRGSQRGIPETLENDNNLHSQVLTFPRSLIRITCVQPTEISQSNSSTKWECTSPEESCW